MKLKYRKEIIMKYITRTIEMARYKAYFQNENDEDGLRLIPVDVSIPACLNKKEIEAKIDSIPRANGLVCVRYILTGKTKFTYKLPITDFVKVATVDIKGDTED